MTDDKLKNILKEQIAECERAINKNIGVLEHSKHLLSLIEKEEVEAPKVTELEVSTNGQS